MKTPVSNAPVAKSKVPLMVFMAVAGLVVGLLLPKLFHDDNAVAESVTSPASQTPPTTTVQNEPLKNQSLKNQSLKNQSLGLAGVRDQLYEEIQARRQLEEKLKKITARVDSLEKTQINVSATDSSQQNSSVNGHTQQDGSQQGGVNTQALMDAGVDEYMANKIRDTYENVEMQKLYLRNRAVREGWFGGDKYRKQLDKLDSQVTSLSGQLNEKQYDAFLYATGQPNRVVIENTLATSPARDAGIKAGDNIISYNNTRVYTWSDLRDATTKCQTDSSVAVELERNGQQQTVYLPCGPMGVRLDNISVQP